MTRGRDGVAEGEPADVAKPRTRASTSEPRLALVLLPHLPVRRVEDQRTSQVSLCLEGREGLVAERHLRISCRSSTGSGRTTSIRAMIR